MLWDKVFKWNHDVLLNTIALHTCTANLAHLTKRWHVHFNSQTLTIIQNACANGCLPYRDGSQHHASCTQIDRAERKYFKAWDHAYPARTQLILDGGANVREVLHLHPLQCRPRSCWQCCNCWTRRSSSPKREDQHSLSHIFAKPAAASAQAYSSFRGQTTPGVCVEQ